MNKTFTNESTLICDSPLWDDKTVWLSSNPHLTDCFRRTILTTFAPIFLLLLIPFDFRYLTKKLNTHSIPWRVRNVTYAILNLVLILISFVYLIHSVWKEVHLWNHVIEIAIDFVGFSASYILLIIYRRYGRRISIAHSMFWFITLIVSIIRLYSEYNYSESNDLVTNLIIYSVYIALSLDLMIISCISDEPNRISLINNRINDDTYCPLENNSAFSRLTLFWLFKFLFKGLNGKIESKDLNKICHSIKAKHVSKIFKDFDNKYNSKANNLSRFVRKKKRLLPVLLRLSFKYILFGLILLLIYLPALYMQPYILDKLLNFLSDNNELKWHGIVYGFAYCLTGLIASLSLLHSDTLMENMAIRCKSALISAIYSKIFKLSPASKKEFSSGEIVNLMSVDCQEVFGFLELGMYLFIAPISLSIGFFFLWQYLGISSLGVVVVLAIITPFTGFIMRKLDKLQKNQMELKDKRMAKISEILNSIKMIKLNAWELLFINSVGSVRKLELKSLRKIAIYYTMTDLVWIMAPMLLAGSCFTSYAIINYTKFNATTIFVSLSILNVLRVPMAIIPHVLSRGIKAYVSIKRIAKYLSAEELDEESIVRDKRDNLLSIVIENATLHHSLEKEPVLKNISMNVRKGSLIAIVGQVGSGKSSLLSAIMGDLYKMKGIIKVNGSKAYVPQMAWIQNMSLKNNIIFTSDEDESRYHEVISACALIPDLNILPSGDATEIGEKGINLSGGQKQRVSLARAVYQNSDIYLLDDPLSSVDAHVAQHLFEKVIGPKGLIRSKTRILCTHQISFLQEVDLIYVLRDKEIVGYGSYQELASLGLLAQEYDRNVINEDNIENIPQFISKTISSRRRTSVKSEDTISLLSTESIGHRIRTHSETIGEKLIEEEHYETGSVKWSDYGKYISSTGITLFIIFILFRIVFNGSEVASNYWLSLWTNLNNTNNDISDRNFRLIIYSSLIANEAVFIFFGDIILFICAIKASEKLHLKALYGIMRSPISFFDKTPIGRILNRFSKDISSVDEEVPVQMGGFFEKITWFPILYFIIFATFTYLALALLAIIVIFYLLYKLYLRTCRQFRRLESISNSPVQSHFCESINGVNSIRAYDVLPQFINESNERIDMSLNTYYHRISLNLWLKLWSNIIGSIITLSIAIYIVINRNDISIGLAGLILTYSTEAVNWLAFTIRSAANLETNMISVERLRQFCELDSESEWKSSEEYKPSIDWPTNGCIEYQNYSTAYKIGANLVLKDINFVIKSGEKVGVVGRTGAGKSSLALSLFRIIEPINGKIFIDKIDITRIGLHDLRSKLTIIPQDPVLFSDTLRNNLDPFCVYDDQQIWNALENSQLKQFVKSMSEGLDFKLNERGDNLSCGQKQLVCLARALLMNSKILVLDEATNACDLDTDTIIQNTIKQKFKSCTLLTIAHRLHTIIDYDRIIVIDFGKIVENDSPNNLLSNTNSIFYSLAKESKLVF